MSCMTLRKLVPTPRWLQITRIRQLAGSDIIVPSFGLHKFAAVVSTSRRQYQRVDNQLTTSAIAIPILRYLCPLHSSYGIRPPL